MQRISISPRLTALVLAVTVLTPGLALADGGYLAPYGYEVYEPAQTAFIHFDTSEEIETLSILPRFWGEPTDFAWVVPVPSLPEVAEADETVFSQLAALSRPLYRSRDSFWDCDDDYDYIALDAPGRDGVEIIEDELIGIYRTMTVGSDDADALADSLTTWGFLHEGNEDTVLPLLEEYVADGWYFVTMTIDSTAVAHVYWPYGKVAKDAIAPYYYYPSLQPITFTFASDEIIYPLRISGISTYETNAVNLYVASDHRVTFPYAQTLYANRITAGERQAIERRYPQLGQQLGGAAFLTKLYRSYTPQELDEDLVLEWADDDAEYLPVSYSGFPVWTVFFGSSVLWWLLRRRRAVVIPASRTRL